MNRALPSSPAPGDAATSQSQVRAPLGRRALLGGIGGGVAAMAGSIATAPLANAAAAVTPVTRWVYQNVFIHYTYNPKTHVTTVTSYRRVLVTAMFSGSAISMKNRAGKWVRVPYVWSASKHALIYDHYLYLRLTAPVKAAPIVTSPNTPYVTTDPARHLLRRATFGVSTADLADVTRLGTAGWVDWQLNPGAISDPAGNNIDARFPNQKAPIWQVRNLIDTGVINGWTQMEDVRTSFVGRAAWSKRQLQAVMEDFWSNHFNVTCPGDPIDDSRADYQQVLRAGALGRFADLLRAISAHPAMLTYLNNRDSTWQHPNENQGRELLELHTVGVAAGYGEAGVLDSARILTGLSVSSDSGEFLYEPWRHWTGTVAVLGFTDANATQAGGLAVANRYFNYLAHHPATATRLATKLAHRFVSDSPSTTLINSLAAVYLANDTAIAPVLRALFGSAEFAGSTGRKVRRPLESVIATVRLLGLDPDAGAGSDGIQALVYQAADGGQAPFGWGPPDGYPDSAAAWASTAVTISRWNTTLDLVAGWWPNQLSRADLAASIFGSTLPTTHAALVDAAAHRLFGVSLRSEHQTAVLTFIGAAAADPVTFGSDAVNWQLPYWIALLLDSPYHVYR